MDAGARRDLRTVIVGAIAGAVVLGGFDVLWSGEWGGGPNPLSWNESARADFWLTLKTGVVLGALIGVAIVVIKRRSRR